MDRWPRVDRVEFHESDITGTPLDVAVGETGEYETDDCFEVLRRTDRDPVFEGYIVFDVVARAPDRATYKERSD